MAPVRDGAPVVQRDQHGVRLPRAAVATASTAEPRRLRGREPVPVVQHRRELHDQHELAVLRRRDDDELPLPDARADVPELRVGRGGHRGRDRDDPRVHARRHRQRRELLARPRARRRLRPVADVRAGRDRPHEPGCRADPQPLRVGHRDPGVRAGDRARSGREPDRDQAARYERRRVLQRELCPPVRERDADLELRRGVRDLVDRRGADLHVRQDGRQRPPGLGAVRA